MLVVFTNIPIVIKKYPTFIYLLGAILKCPEDFYKKKDTEKNVSSVYQRSYSSKGTPSVPHLHLSVPKYLEEFGQSFEL